MWQEELVDALRSAPWSEKSQVMSEYRDMTGYSDQQLYRIAARYGYKPGKKPRSDKGILKSGITDGQIEMAASLIYQTRREVKGPIMPVEMSMEIMEDNHYLNSGQISVARMQQLLREREMCAAALKNTETSQPMRSLHPNHVHVFDVSVCVQYYLRSGGKGMRIMDERDYYKNKMHNIAKIKLRLLRYVVVDHFSGLFYFRYFNTTGETQNNFHEFILEAWADKNNDKFPFRGVPFEILMDAGSANTSRAVVSFLKRLGVHIPEGEPYNSKRQGACEVMHNYIEKWFESGLRLQPASTLEDLNAWALDRQIYLNSKRKHTRHGMTRTQCWLLIKPEQLRELPDKDLLTDLYSYTDEDYIRTISRDYTISYKGEDWNVKHIAGIIPGRSKVQIVIKPFTPELIGVLFNETVYEAYVIKKLPAELGGFRADAAVIGQEYKSQPETLTERAVKRFDNMAYGENTPDTRAARAKTIPFEGLTVFGNHAEKVDISFIAKHGTPVEIDRGIAEKQISFMEFLKRLTSRVGAISKDLNQQLRAEIGNSIEVSRAEELIREMESNPLPNGLTVSNDLNILKTAAGQERR